MTYPLSSSNKGRHVSRSLQICVCHILSSFSPYLLLAANLTMHPWIPMQITIAVSTLHPTKGYYLSSPFIYPLQDFFFVFTVLYYYLIRFIFYVFICS